MNQVIDLPRILAEPSSVRGSDEVLTEAALDFLGELHERFDSRRLALLEAREERQDRFKFRRAAGLSRRYPGDTRGGVDRRSDPARSPRSPSRNHRSDQRKNGDQRAQQRCSSVHGRF